MMFSCDVGGGVSLTLIDKGDAEELFALVDDSRMYLRDWLPWVDAHASVEDTHTFIASSQKQYADGNGFQCCIRHQDKIVGVIGFHRIDWFHKHAEIGYWLAEHAQGRGIMTRCCRALVDFAFKDYKLHRIEIIAAVANKKSRAIPERLGFTYEGTLRGKEWLNDHFVDGAVYSMLDDEWGAEG